MERGSTGWFLTTGLERPRNGSQGRWLDGRIQMGARCIGAKRILRLASGYDGTVGDAVEVIVETFVHGKANASK